MTTTNGDYYQNEMLLRDTMKAVFPDMKTVYDFRAKWLWRDKIAVYFPQVNVGVEFSVDGHDASLSRKWVACKEHGIALFVLLSTDIEQRRFSALQRMIDSRLRDKPRAASKKPRR